ncbi:MAG: preprotein translocase subunit SecE [Gammaproteobacteria bacterium]|nr:MAG: preprotein translocase subunit SecE [Gammaproteobacteria bacterium]RLA19913.1 MAG: preprotein translocase subunit SecE [Gammaproteobacteria bacterium]
MSDNTESSSSALDTVKLSFAVLLLAGSVAAFYLLGDQAFLVRLGALVALILVALGAVFTTSTGRNIWGFLVGARTEVRKVVWPTRQETMQTTLVVIVVVFIVGLILWLLDMSLVWGIQLVTGQGG